MEMLGPRLVIYCGSDRQIVVNTSEDEIVDFRNAINDRDTRTFTFRPAISPNYINRSSFSGYSDNRPTQTVIVLDKVSAYEVFGV